MSTASPLGTALALWLGAVAGWTVGSVPLTLTGATFGSLWIAGVTALIGMGLAWLARGTVARAVTPMEPAPPEVLPDRRPLRLWLAVAGAGALGLGALWFIPTSDALLLWAAVLAAALPGVWLGRGEALPQTPAAPAPLWGVLLLAAVIVGLYATVSRPDADDAFYLNLPIALKAGGPMMVWDAMHGVEGWPLLGSNYRVEALPTLTAALSAVTGLPVLAVAHGALPVLWCLAFAATLALIGQALLGRRWWVFAGLVVALGMIFGGTLQSWGVHWIFRLFHGKGPLVTVIVPLIVFVVLTHRGGRIGMGGALALLLGLQTIAVGLTANAIYLAPLALGLPLAAGVLADGRAGLTRLPLLLSALPPVAAGLWLILFDPPTSDFRGPGGGDTTLALWNMTGDKTALALLVAILLGGALAGVLARRGAWASAYVVAVAVFVLNPVLWPIYGQSVTGGLNFRLWWAIPVPMLAALGLVRILPRAPLVSAAAVAVVVALAVVAPTSVLRAPGTEIAPGLAKVPPGYAVARRASAAAPEGTAVLAPEDVAAWLATFEGHARPVYVRRLYLSQGESADRSAEMRDDRDALAAWVDGEADLPPEQLSALLDALCVSVVVGDRGAMLADTPGVTVITSDDAPLYVVETACAASR